MTDSQSLDEAAITRYLTDNLDGFRGPVEITKFETGQSNPTFRIATPDRAYVLRRKPSGQLLKSAHAVDREYRVQTALEGSEVPVSKMHLLCEDPSVIGTAFYVMDFVPGRNFLRPDLPGLSNADRAGVANEMNRVLAALHEVDIEARGLADYGPPGNYYQRQIGRWTKQYYASETGPMPEMDRFIARLKERIPEDDGQRRLVHGDYRIDNMIFDAETTDCRAVLDWELSTIGHPYADLAAVIMQWNMPAGAESRGLAGLDRATLGLPSDEAFIARYCDRRGIGKIDDFGFFLGFAFFRMAAIIQGVKKRGLEGNASNPEKAARAGKRVPAFVAGGLRALDRA